jgi:uncharacterized protein
MALFSLRTRLFYQIGHLHPGCILLIFMKRTFYYRIVLLLSIPVFGYGQFNQGKNVMSPTTQSLDIYAIRLLPGQDLRHEIMQLALTRKIKAGCILTCVGSLQAANLRFANQPQGTLLSGKFEIVSLVGTFSDETAHLHLCISDSTGVTIGGHLIEGNLVYTTVELVIGSLPHIEFTRETDPTYGYKELVVRKRRK